MIDASFLYRDNFYIGYEIKGHAGAGELGKDILCSAVSSAAYLTANTLTEIVKAPVEVVERDGYMRLLLQGDYERCQDMLSGLHLHLKELARMHRKYIRVSIKVGVSSGDHTP